MHKIEIYTISVAAKRGVVTPGGEMLLTVFIGIGLTVVLADTLLLMGRADVLLACNGGSTLSTESLSFSTG